MSSRIIWTIFAIFIACGGTYSFAQDAKDKNSPPPVFGLDYSPDGRWLAASGGYYKSNLGSLAVWDTKNWKPRFIRVEHRGISHLAFSADSKRLAYVLDDLAVVVDTQSWKEIHRWQAHQGRALSIAFSPDGTTLTTSGEGGTVILWNATTARRIKSFKAHREDTYHVEFSPDGKTLLTGGHDAKAILWNADTLKSNQVFEPSDSIVRRVRWSKDGKFFLTCRWDGYLRIRESSSGSFVGFADGGSDWADLSADKKLLVTTGQNNEARVFRVKLEPLTPEQENQVRKLVSKFEDDDYQVREAAEKQIAEFGMPAVPVLREFAESKDAEIRIRTRRLRKKLLTAKQIATLGGHAGDVEVICLSPDEKQIATGCRGGDLKLWNASSFQELRSMQLPTEEPPNR